MLRTAGKGMPVLLLTALARSNIGSKDWNWVRTIIWLTLCVCRTARPGENPSEAGKHMITESQFKVADLSIDLVSRKSVAPETALCSPVKSSACWNFHSPSGRGSSPLPDCLSGLGMNFDSDTNAIDVAVKRLRAK